MEGEARALLTPVSHPKAWVRIDGKNIETNNHAVRARKNTATDSWGFNAERKDSRSAPYQFLGTFDDSEKAQAACEEDWKSLPFNRPRVYDGPIFFAPVVRTERKKRARK